MKKIVLSLLMAFFFVMPAFSQVSMKEGYGHMTGMGNMDRMGDLMGMCIEKSEKIGLDDDQIVKMKPLHVEMMKNRARFMADQKIAEIEFMGIMEVKDFDMEKASVAVNKISEIKSFYYSSMLKNMKEIRTILTDDQFKEMKKLMSMNSDEKTSVKNMMKK